MAGARVGEGDGVSDGFRVEVGVGVRDGVDDDDGVRVEVRVAVRDEVGDGDGVRVEVRVAVIVGNGDAVRVGGAVGGGDEVWVGVKVGVACPQPASNTTTASNKPTGDKRASCKRFMKSLPLPN
jgi:hypothetical protein